MPALDPSAAIDQAYAVALSPVEVEIVVKKSRFIARAAFAADRAQALQLLAQAKADYPDARHHCWAYLLGSPRAPCSQAFADAGEPAGTAGKPILNVLQHKDIGDLMVIVIRYFGGIKLGAGGLVRAYSHAAQAAIEQLRCRPVQRQQRIELGCDFAQEQHVRYWLDGHEGAIIAVDYGTAVSIQASIPCSALPQWRAEAARLKLEYRHIES